MDSKLKKKFRASIGIAVFCAILVIAFFLLLPAIYDSFETKTLDLRFQFRGPITQRQDILFLEMDEPSIQALGRWPWPRDIFARIVEVLKELKAKAVLFDVTFTEPAQLIVDKDKLSLGLNLDENKKLLTDFISDTQQQMQQAPKDLSGINSALTQLKEGIGVWEKNINDTLAESMKDNDRILSESIRDAGNVYLGYHFEVIHTPLDIKRGQTYQRFKEKLDAWIKNNPRQQFINLPFALKNIWGFTAAEIKTIFTRAKLHYLISNNLELLLSDACRELAEEFAALRPHYNDVKAEVYREKIAKLLETAPSLSFKEIVWKLNMFNAGDLQLLNRQYQNYCLEKTFAEKIGIPYNDDKGFLKAVKLSPPILPLTESMKSAGFLNAIADEDGTLRKAPLLVRYKDRLYPHIALKIIFDLWGINPKTDIRINPGKSIIIGNRLIPVDTNGCLLLNWGGTWANSFQHLSAYEVYRLWEIKQNVENNLKLSEEELKEKNLKVMLEDDQKKLAETAGKLTNIIGDKICIIGLTAPGTHDYTPIPLESNYPAVGTHANILNTILEGKFPQRLDTKINIAIVFLIGILTAACVSLLSPVNSFIFIFITISLYSAASFLLFSCRGLWIDIIGPVGTAFLSYLGITSYNFATEEKEKRWIRNAFGHYISKNVMEEILKDPARLKLGGERKELSVLFADVRGFTGYSEHRQPEEVVAILNEYLDKMTKVILKHNGTLDKYVGDAIMAIFGAPATTAQTGHAQKAVTVALEMIEELKVLQEKWRSEGKEPLDIGIGINTGIMLVGNMGSAERMDYTVIGDAVNLAARIESLTRTYNNHIMISEFTYEKVRDLLEVKPLEAIKVKGKEKPVMMYEVLGAKKINGA